jgi:alpha-glucoside transport system substrate-binding protein
MNRQRWLLLARLLLAPVAALALFAACGDDDDDEDGDETPSAGRTPGAGGGDIGSVTVLGIWGAEELDSWEAMYQPWENDTGGTVEFTGTRDTTALLRTRVEGGNPPDIAIPAEIGLFQQFARDGELVPLSQCPGLEDTVRQNYPESFIELGTVDGELYGFFMKTDTKGTIWYNPAFFSANNLQPLTADSTFEDLASLSDQILATGTPPWSNGQNANGSTGFPGSDTIQQIIINEAGVDAYDAVASGEMPYTDDVVRDAWEKFGQLVLTDGYTSQGGAQGVLATPFRDSAFPPFEDPPEAGMVHLGGFAGGFITEQFAEATPGEDFNFFPWPGGAVTGGANIVYAFNSDDGTCSFMSYLASAEAQQIWVERGGFTSVNREVDLSSYPDETARGQAEQLLNAETFRFDMDDLIGAAGQQAIFQGIIQYLQNPNNLDQILSGIDGSIEVEPDSGTPTGDGTPAGGATPSGTRTPATTPAATGTAAGQ